MTAKLVPIPDIERLSPTCIRVLGGNPGRMALQGTNTYLVGTGPERILIDTGEGKSAWIESIQRTLEAEKATVTKALVTHWHIDHVSGVKQLLGLSPTTEIYKNRPELGFSDIQDGQEFRVEGATVRAVHAPGHTVDHMVFLLEEEDAMFTGDNVLGQGTSVFEDLGQYLASLAHMKSLFRGRAYPGHGPVLEDGPAKIQEYIKHRRDREDQVVQKLRSKKPAAAEPSDNTSSDDGEAWTPAELVQAIYWDVGKDLHPAAARGVVLILDKLAEEGKVAQDDEGRWRLKSRSPL